MNGDIKTEKQNVDLIELQNRIYKQNCELGWWEEERPFYTIACLFHSEPSEAMEGDRKGLTDDHLPNYEMFWVELADSVIRFMDWLGHNNHLHYRSPRHLNLTSRTHLLAEVHLLISKAYEQGKFGDKRRAKGYISEAVSVVLGFADMNDDVDLISIIKEKVAYNKTRADHKRECRARIGGKKY